VGLHRGSDTLVHTVHVWLLVVYRGCRFFTRHRHKLVKNIGAQRKQLDIKGQRP